MNFHNAEFVKSAAALSDIITDTLPKIVFSGRSNVGKSSVINRLINRKQFARVSATPGKTAHINYFLLDKTAYLVDLPGYGYAKTAKSEYLRWSKLMESYFTTPSNITLGVLIVDARHMPTADDITMTNWYIVSGRPFTVVANKTDKVKNSILERNIDTIRHVLKLPGNIQIIAFSALNGTGREMLISKIKESINGGSIF